MLLPSALPCDIMAVAALRPQRPKLLSLGAYVPVPPQQDSYTGGLFASCRALHSILGNPQVPQSQSHAQATTTLAAKATHSASPFAPKRLRSPPVLIRAPRGLNKRRRDEFEDDQPGKENIPSTPEDHDLYQTPKRQRRIPLEIPLGLQVSDFAGLGHTPAPTTPRRERDEDVMMPPSTVEEDSNVTVLPTRAATTTQSPVQTRSRRRSKLQDSDANDDKQPPDPALDGDVESRKQEQWSPLDDRKLVEVVLSKLNLSRRDWNDCAKQLGKDKDSLGRRWRMLIGEGNVGLRRGLGRHERGDLDIKSW